MYGQKTTTSIELINGAIFALIGIRGDISVAMDSQGDIAIQVSVGGGGYIAAGASFGPSVTSTNAPSVDKLNGWAVQMGGQLGEGASLTVEKVFFKDSETNEKYNGTSLGGAANLLAPWPGELHATVTHTWTLYKVNVNDLITHIFK